MLRKKRSHKKNKNHKEHHLLPADLSVENVEKFIKKKIDLFYKITFSLLVIGFILLAYFVILVSSEPKSIPYVTQKIESGLKEKFGDKVAIENSYISFTRYGTLNVSVANLAIIYGAEKQSFVIPRLETEFSLLNLLLMRFQPSKIRAVDPVIVLDELQKMNQPQTSEGSNYANAVLDFLSKIRNGKSPIENFEIENARLVFNEGKAQKRELLIKKAQIRASNPLRVLHFSAVSKISFDKNKADVDLKSNCKLSRDDGLKCDVNLENFVANSIADLHPKLNVLNRINTVLNANSSFAMKEGKVESFSFKAQAKEGDFEFPDFFSQKMHFNDFLVSGEYDNKLDALNLSEIKTDFLSFMPGQQMPLKSQLEMSLLISNITDPAQKLDFLIKLANVPNDEMERFWPSALHHNDIRKWVIEHIKGGMVKNAYAKFSLINGEVESNLTSMDAEVIFSDFNLEYSKEFPALTRLAGVASFTMKGMKIAVNSGDVLKSKISDGLVVIEDFHAPTTMLKISGKSRGHASDGLKHAHNSSEFAVGVERYLNGDSQNEFDIRIPISDHVIDLKNTYIAVNSAVTNLDNPYVKGGALINTKKDFGNNNFVTNIDFTAAELTAKAFDVEKKSNVESGLDLVVVVKDAKKIQLKNIALWKKEEKEKLARITGDVMIETDPLKISALNFRNDNFGKNNFALSMKNDEKGQKISLRGDEVNFASFVENKFSFGDSGGDFLNSQINVGIKRLKLARDKSIRNLVVSLNCKEGICAAASAKGSYGKKQFINLRTVKNSGDQLAAMEGRITDVGYLAEGFGISNTVSGGDAKVKLQSKMINKKPVLEGEVVINNNITIYENATVKRLSKDNLFSQIKDKIFSSEKTTFDSVKVEFDLQNNILNIKSLIANNYKIGITAKGAMDLKNDTYEIKGMIIPGFLINNLFGIGKIPILGNVIGLLTGGEGGGLFGIKYEYVKKKGQSEPSFKTDKVSAFVPTTIQNLFDLI